MNVLYDAVMSIFSIIFCVNVLKSILYFMDMFFIMYILVLIKNVDSLYTSGINIKVINVMIDNTIMIISIVDTMLLNFFLKKHFNGYKK